MINAEFGYGEKRNIIFIAKGHSGAAESGKDLICAGATTLGYTLAQTVLDAFNANKLSKKPIITLDKGDIRIECVPKRLYYSELLYGFYVIQNGYEVLGHNYPDNVALTHRLT